MLQVSRDGDDTAVKPEACFSQAAVLITFRETRLRILKDFTMLYGFRISLALPFH